MSPEAGPSTHKVSPLGPETRRLGSERVVGFTSQNSAGDTPSSTKGKSRRVPYDQRQRVEVSCDRCKRRKIRCKRPNGAENTCEGCAKSGQSCESTLPRKERSYVRTEGNDLDQSSLLAIIHHLAPGRHMNTKDDLLHLAQELGIALPPSSRVDDTPQSGTLPSHDIPSVDASKQIRIPEGRLLPAPAGGYHYVGPASSIYFAMTVRHLVMKTNRIWMAATEGNVFERMIKAAEFTSFGVSKALEARIEGHPATNAANDEGEGHLTDNLPVHPEDQTKSATTTSPLNYLRHGRWKSLLPDRKTADLLVHAFFEKVHPNYTLFHRGTFYTNYEVLWSLDDHRLRTMDVGWICALMMVLVLGALALEGDGFMGASELQQRYLTIVLRDGFPRLTMTASLFNVQTLMLLALYQHNAGERNGAWMIIGQAARMAIALGMHRDGDVGNFDPIERNTRRMVWWVLYNFEQNMSFVLGRPSATDIIDRTVRLPDESVMDGQDLPLGFFQPSGSLAELSVGIKRFVASISVDYDQIELLSNNCARARELYTQLDNWYRALPPHLHPQSHFPTTKHKRAVILLHIHFRYIRSILGRPFLLGLVSHEIDNQSSPSFPLPILIRQLAEMAIEAARGSVDLLGNLTSSNLLEGQVWLDLFYVHHATFILGLPLLSCPEQEAQRCQLDKVAIRGLLGHCQKMFIAPTYRILLNIAMQFTCVVDWGPDDINNIPAQPIPVEPSNRQLDLRLGEAPPIQPTWDQMFGPLPSRQSSPRDLFADLYNYGLDPDPDAQIPWDFFNLSALASNDAGEQPNLTSGDASTIPSQDQQLSQVSGVMDLLSELL